MGRQAARRTAAGADIVCVCMCVCLCVVSKTGADLELHSSLTGNLATG